MSLLQHTLLSHCRFDGIGLHSGKQITMLIEPAPIGTGIAFQRSDLADAPLLPANAAHVSTTVLSTTLGPPSFGISTIEHVMAALCSLGVDNAFIRVSGPEAPIADGSAGPFADAIAAAGLQQQEARRTCMKLLRSVTIQRGNSRIHAEPADSPSIESLVEYPVACIGRQQLSYTPGIASFALLCDARTFCLARDIDAMRAQGLAKGGSLDNAVVASDEGIQNPGGLRYADEAVRHKTLDAIGDLALLGAPLLAAIRIEFGGHALHVALVKELLARSSELLAPSEISDNAQWAKSVVGLPWPTRQKRILAPNR